MDLTLTLGGRQSIFKLKYIRAVALDIEHDGVDRARPRALIREQQHPGIARI